MKQLSPPPAPLQWTLYENGTAAAAPDASPAAGFKPVLFTATKGAGLHRVGLVVPPTDVAKAYTVTAWFKAGSDLDAMFELGATGDQNKQTAYAVSYFDVSDLKVVANPVVTPETQMKNVSIVKEGDWVKLSGPINVAAGSRLSIVVGEVKNGTHYFDAVGDEQMTIGGIALAEAGAAPAAPAAAPAAVPAPAPASQPEAPKPAGQ